MPLYIATHTRPDIAVSINRFARYVEEPSMGLRLLQ